MKKFCYVFLGIFVFYSVGVAEADELSELKDQMKKIEEENIRLQKQLDEQRVLTQKLLGKIEALEGKPPVPVLEEEIEAKELIEMPRLDIKGFSDISFRVEEEVDSTQERPNTFALGQINIFFASALSDRISALSETVFEFDSENEVMLDVERLELKYALSEVFNIRFGRMHTTMGFWNTEYHHGTWLHTTAFRPLIHNWEDEDGIIPNHFVGLYVFGKKDFDNLDFEYDLGIANGRGETRTEIQNFQDANDSKAFNARLSILPDFVPGLKFGTSVYIDKIPPDSSVPARDGEIDELIIGGHIVYFKEKVELLAEVLHLNHDDEVSRKDYETLGLYLQGAYQLFDRWKPYYRIDFIDFGNVDPYYTPDDIDITRHTIGIRWDPITWAAIKLEYSYSDRDSASDRHTVTVQSAFTF